MLLIASETIRTNRTLNDLVREMSLTPSYFASPGTFAELMLGRSRRIVVLTEDDVCTETVRTLRGAKDRAPFGVIVTANRASLRGAKEAELVEKLASYENIEWIGRDFDFDKLSASARRCRRRPLPVDLTPRSRAWFLWCCRPTRRLISMPGAQTNPKWSPSVISN